MTRKNKLFKRVTSLKVWQLMLYDSLAICLTYGLAIGALTITDVSGFDHVRAIIILPFIIVFKLIIYIIFKLYRLVLDNVGFDEVFKIAVAIIFSNITIALITISIPNFELNITIFVDETNNILPVALANVFPWFTAKITMLVINTAGNVENTPTKYGGKISDNNIIDTTTDPAKNALINIWE